MRGKRGFVTVLVLVLSCLFVQPLDGFANVKLGASLVRMTATPRNTGARTEPIVTHNGYPTYSGSSLDKEDGGGPTTATILGGGSFGLAMAFVLSRSDIKCKILVRRKEVADAININRASPTYLSDMILPSTVLATTDPVFAFQGTNLIIHAVPVQFSRKYLEGIKAYLPPDVPILSTSKGIETKSLSLMVDIIKETCGNDRPMAVLSGPSFAREMAMGLATAVVIASERQSTSIKLAKMISHETFRCFVSRDVIGVEVGGAVKNVIALAAGMCEGLGLGTNAMAGLVTRGCLEMKRIACALGGSPSTLDGLSGVGDTFGTCFGPLSRNRNLGVRLGQGERLEDIVASSTEVAEGVDTAFALVELISQIDNSFRIDLKYSIIFGVADILRGNTTPREGLMGLMTMPLRLEMYTT